jgi:hypothetical protein
MRILSLALAVALTVGAVVLAAIETEQVPLASIKGENWTFDFTFRPIQRLEITNADGTKQAYWYLLYVVTNNTGRAREFVPEATMFTDNGVAIRDGIYPAVVAEVKKMYRLKNLKNSVDMMSQKSVEEPAGGKGKTEAATDKAATAESPATAEKAKTVEQQPSLKAGEDEAEQGILVFQENDPRMKGLKLFITGLSGEFIVRDLPSADPAQKSVAAVLRKTMELTYKCPGLDPVRNETACYLDGQKWIWR